MKKITLSFPAVILVSLLIQSFGLFKSLLLAKDFGANSTIDAFYLANVFTISIFTIVGSAITTIVIPELNTQKGFKEKKGYIENYLTIITILSVTISLVMFFVILIGGKWIAPKFDSTSRLLFILMTGILLISQQFKIQASFSISLFQNEGHYILPRAMDLIPVLIPFLYLIMSRSANIIFLTIFTALAYIIETFFFNYLQAKMNPLFVFRPNFDFNQNVRVMMLNTVPILLSSTVFQFQVLLSNYFAGFFGRGYITLLSNANQIMGIFQSLFIMNLVNMIYPRMVKDLKKNLSNGISKISQYVSLTNLVVIILIWGYLAVGFDLVKLLFVRGHFTLENARIVYNYGVVLGVVLPFDVLRDYCYRTYYAIGNTKKPMLNSISTVILNIFLLIVLSRIVGSISIVLAPALGTIVSMIMILIRAYSDGIRIKLLNIFGAYVATNILGFSMYYLIRTIHYSSSNLAGELIINVLIGAMFIGCVLLLGLGVFYLVRKLDLKNNN